MARQAMSISGIFRITRNREKKGGRKKKKGVKRKKGSGLEITYHQAPLITRLTVE